ncbi:hypothetical protein Tel_03520 [Candidatus Tenderia electrophaga]|jgi:copper chaperone CopZ|uniref:HMA domain-containing protein n=1 Tax=Candidatus Tenderia electrophaga TaxID=1748243 RepID=A0A0S2TAZ6_9GAMM|nr:hypothetical protein Tel_03520 [Candidatus Tenderia electrophaga]
MQTEHLKIAGMSCGGCTGKVTDALKAVPGVGEINVSLSAGEATVQYDERLTSPEQLNAAVQEAGYAVDTAGTAKEPKGKGGCCCS